MLQKINAKLVEKSKLNDDTDYLKFELIEPTQIDFTAGQYVLVQIPKPEGGLNLRHFSIANPPAQNQHLEFLAKIIPGGVASEYFLALGVGDTMLSQGPIGLFRLHESERDKIFLATGTGLAPILSILRSWDTNKSHAVRLFWGLRKYEDVYYLDKFKKLAETIHGFRFTICLSREEDLSKIPEMDREYFQIGHIDHVYANTIEKTNASLYDYYLCGGRAVVESLRQFLNEYGAPGPQVFFEKF